MVVAIIVVGSGRRIFQQPINRRTFGEALWNEKEKQEEYHELLVKMVTGSMVMVIIVVGNGQRKLIPPAII